ncbi:MAG: peptidoglycan D,D-transpeptidase FtsI family protein [Candidatus Kapaibacteriales bacterium]
MRDFTFELQNLQVKFKVFVLLILFLFVILIARLFYIQILNRSYYQELAQNQQIVKIQLQGKRGEIFDRNGITLVSNVHSRSYALDPKYIKKNPNVQPIVEKFLNNLGIDKNNFLKWLSLNKNFIWIKRGLIENEVKYLDTFDFPGLIKISEIKRFYLFDNVASNIIGFSNIDNNGISGIEHKFDSILKGKQAQAIFFRDAHGRLKPNLEFSHFESIDGTPITLTIDINLQRLAEYHLIKTVNRTKAKSGCVIIINPENGEILSLANYPNFNPNNVMNISNEELKIVAVNSAFEPGSTLKPIILAIALENRLIDENEIFSTFGGKLNIGDVQIFDEHPTTEVNIEQAIAYSSNIAMVQIASRIPSEILLEGLYAFGLGKKTGLELPGELSGSLKTLEELTPTQIKYIGFGYGITATPIQLLTAYCSIANGGFLIKPHLIKEIRTSNQKSQENQISSKRIISESTANKIKNYLTKVVEYGTGKSAKIEGLSIAGKTGTAQKYVESKYSKSNYLNTFIGFFPVESPKMVILIFLDEPQTEIYASTTVAPVFRELVLGIHNSQNIKYLFN